MKYISVRKPVVAGRFYPSSPDEIRNQIKSFESIGVKKEPCIACMLPHAGYTYSGRVAVQVVSRMNIPEKVILIGPNHTGLGAAFSIQTEGVWQTPLGQVKIDSGLAQEILGKSEYLKQDSEAHLQEHSLEVELPILQYFAGPFEIVPICVLSDDVKALKQIGKSIAEVIKSKKIQGSCLIVASSDMTHYEPQELAEKKDKEAIKAILGLDIEALDEKVRTLNISMCGYAPVTVMLSCARALGAKNAELVNYQTSGDVTGDKDSVVGYAGIIIK